MRTGKLRRSFSKLGPIEMSQLFSSTLALATYFRGRYQIDTVWVTPNIIPSVASIVLLNFGVGNYRVFVIDFLTELILGNKFMLIYKVEMKRLITC